MTGWSEQCPITWEVNHRWHRVTETSPAFAQFVCLATLPTKCMAFAPLLLLCLSRAGGDIHELGEVQKTAERSVTQT